MKIVVSRGLDLSLKGAPKESGFCGKVDPLVVSVDLRPFAPLPLGVKVSPEDHVTAGTPLAEYKTFPGVFITSPVDGEILEIRRGHKRSLLDIVIRKKPGSSQSKFSYDLQALSREELLEVFKKEGLFALFKQRPFDIPALPSHSPRDVFINLADNRPFTPSVEKHLSLFSSKEDGYYIFVVGVQAIAKLFGLKPHIIATDKLSLPSQDLVSIAHLHTVKGPFPSGSPSTHIHHIARIKNDKDIVFTISFQEVLSIGHLFLKGFVLGQQIVALAGSALPPSQRKYLITAKGASFKDLLSEEIISSQDISLIAGDPLTGRLCSKEENPCLGFRDHTITLLPNPKVRESLSFLRLGWNKHTVTRTYLSGFFKRKRVFMDMDTNLHGEKRPIIDAEIYDRVSALPIPVALLIKALETQNFEEASRLGLLEIAPEDFALPTFIDPSKTEMFAIVKESLLRYAKENVLPNV
ncbi:Na(+)-translocating NADH-quinone reductase subunit A [Chlamydia suis]|uniref:Na(+)-translocating NADH-quinone reductase subunit A n=1 Tax=Chlamydia suis TaxID=83559 RepID=UPI0009AF2444|nr:Na(+)-translocating NADH-quinone reductase subunit A [Chlamydia suis]